MPVRPDSDGVVSADSVRRARWNVPYGGRVIVSIYGCRDFTGEAADLIGRIVTDAHAADVQIQCSGSGGVVGRLRDAIQTAATQYATIQNAHVDRRWAP